MKEYLLEIKKELYKKLKKDRFEHTIGVMYTAASLAMCYGADVEKAMAAGLLHDCGKYCSIKDQIKLCNKFDIHLNHSELAMPALIHAKLGAFLASYEYDIADEEILNAIRFHTTGRPDMSLLEKIVYISDYIEPNRKEIPGLVEIRSIVFNDLNRAVYLSSGNTIQYLKASNNQIDPMTIKTYEFYGGIL